MTAPTRATAGSFSEVVGPPAFHEQPDHHHVDALRDRVPKRWKAGQRDSVESLGAILGAARDHGLYRKVGAGSWESYCREFLASPPGAMDELIEGVRILKGRAAAREAGLVGETVSVVLQGDTAARLKAEAKRLGVPVSRLVQNFVEAGLGDG